MPKSLSMPLLAAIIGSALLIAGIAIFGATSAFMGVEGLVIVIGGSVANAFLSYRREDVYKAFAVIRNMLKVIPDSRANVRRDVMRFIGWAYVLQSQDVMGLEKEAEKSSLEPVLRYGMDLSITGYSADTIRDMMHTVADAEFEQSCMPVVVLRNMAATAPAFGMVGTLIGMILILHNIGTDISGLSGGLAIAMLSTLYGILVARLVCLPAADKLLGQEEATRLRHYMLAEGFAMLAEKQSPFYMLDRLNSFITPSKHFDLLNYPHAKAYAPPATTVAATAAA